MPMPAQTSWLEKNSGPAIYRYVEGEQKKPEFTPADMFWDLRNTEDGTFMHEVFTYRFPVGHRHYGKTYDFAIVFYCTKHKKWEAAGLWNVITPLGKFETQAEAKAAVVAAAWSAYNFTVQQMNQPPEQEG